MKIIIILCIVAISIKQGCGYPKGAPAQTCLTMFPHHGMAVQQTTPSPFTITPDKTSYSPSENITVVISAADNRMFKGFEMKVHRAQVNKEVIEGQFVDFPTDKLQVFDCFGGTENLITHTNNNDTANLTITWMAPSENVGDIEFTATIVQDFATFWFNVKVTVTAASSQSVTEPLFKLPTINPAASGINFEDCGKTMGCLFHPETCTGSNCSAVAAFTDNKDGTLTFQLSGPVMDNAGYISIGLSKDRTMGADETFVCAITTDAVSVQHSYNPKHYTVLDYTRGFTNVQTSKTNNTIYCKFTRSINSTLYQETGLTFDLGGAYYLQMAWGYTYSNTGQIKKHTVTPIMTNDMIRFSQNNIFLTVTSAPVDSAPVDFTNTSLLMTVLLIITRIHL